MKLKTSWHFTKWDGLNIVLVIHYITCPKNFTALQIFLNIFLLKWKKKWRKFWAQCILLSSKILFHFWIKAWFLFFFQMVIFTTLWKSTLKMALFRRCLTLFKSTLFNSTLFNVVNFNVDVHNVISTLIWRCVTSRCHINPKTTLKRRWNVCWVMIHPEVPIGCPKKDFEFSEANRLFFIRIKTKIDEAQYSYYFKVLSLKMFLFRSYFVRNLLMLLGYVYSWGVESYIIR